MHLMKFYYGHVDMSMACPWGTASGKPGEYVGEYKGMDWMNCFKFEGKRVGKLQILDGDYGISRGFIAKSVL